MSAEIGFAVVGAGRIGALHARHLTGAVAGARLKLVVDVDLAAAERAARGVAEHASEFEAVLQHPDVAAVVIASPTPLHAQQVQAAAAAGLAVFCEKPLANDLATSAATVAAVERSGVPFQIGFHRRFDPAYAELARAVTAGEIGRVELFRSQSTDPAPAPEAYIAASGGIYKDSVIHDLDIARFVAGEVTRVTALGRVLVDPVFGRYGDVDTSVLTLEFASGALGVLLNSRRTSYGHDLRVEVHGAGGKLVAEDERATKLWRYDGSGVRGDYYHFFIERFREAYRLELEAFVTAVAAGSQPAPSARDAIASLRLAEAAGLSLKTGRPVELASLEAELEAATAGETTA